MNTAKSTNFEKPSALSDSTNATKDSSDKNANTNKPVTENTEKEPVKPKNPYLSNGIDLDFIKAISVTSIPKPKPAEVPKPTLVKEQSASVM